MDSRCQATIGRVSNPNHGTHIIYIYIYIGVLGGRGDCGCLIVYVRILTLGKHNMLNLID